MGIFDCEKPAANFGLLHKLVPIKRYGWTAFSDIPPAFIIAVVSKYFLHVQLLSIYFDSGNISRTSMHFLLISMVRSHSTRKSSLA